MKERDLISTIAQEFSATAHDLIKGIGDDCAVFKKNGKDCWLISTDLLVEKSHFNLDWQSPFLLGRKSIAVNLSDIAAMGATPRFVLLSIELPRYISDIWLTEFRSGVKNILEEFDCLLIGGDTTSGNQLTISVSIIGFASTELIVYRSGAIAGHDIYVSGQLGDSAAGLELLQKGLKKNADCQQVILSHLDPQPQIRAGRALAESHAVSAMQDISDGLSTDISHICKESRVGAIIEEKYLPYTSTFTELCQKYQLNKRSLILHGGEDYQLVFTADKSNRTAIKNISRIIDQPFYRVGFITEKPGVYLLTEEKRQIDIQFKGFEHKTPQ